MTCDENQPLLNDDRVHREQTCVVDDSEALPIGHFKLFGSLLVDSIPGKSYATSCSCTTHVATVILSYSLQNSIQATTILIAARLGPEELSAASVALMLAFVTGEWTQTYN